MAHRTTKTLLALTLAIAGGWSLTAGAAEGLYSSDDLIGSPVHASGGERVGVVEDLLLGDTMEVHSLIIEIDNVVGLGGREVVAERGAFTVETVDSESAFNDIAYEVQITAGTDEVEGLPEYNEGWWNRTTDSLEQAWQNTQEGSRNAWERTQEIGSSAWENIRQGAQSLGESIGDAVGGDGEGDGEQQD